MAQRIGSLPSAAEKVVPIAIAIVAYLLFIFATIATQNLLPFWQYGAGTVILLIVIGWLLLQKPAPTAQAGKPARDYLGWIKSSLWKIVLVVATMGFVGSGIYFGIMEVPDKVYSAQELLQHKVSGNCQAQGDELVCAGPWKIVIPNKNNVGWVKAYPGKNSPFKTLTIEVGSYKADYYQVNTLCDGTSVARLRSNADIIYKGNLAVDPNSCRNVLVSQTGTMQNEIYLGSSWCRLVPLFCSENPQVFVGGYYVIKSNFDEADEEYLGGNITIMPYHGQSATIGRVEVVYSSYSWPELIAKKTGIKI